MTMSSRLPWRHVGVRVARIVGGAEQSPGQQRAAARPSGANLIGRAGSQATPPGDSEQQRPSRPERTAAGAIAVASAITRPIRSTQLGRLGCGGGGDGGEPRVSSAQSQDAQSVWAQLPRTAQGDSYFSLHALPPNATVPRPPD